MSHPCQSSLLDIRQAKKNKTKSINKEVLFALVVTEMTFIWQEASQLVQGLNVLMYVADDHSQKNEQKMTCG